MSTAREGESLTIKQAARLAGYRTTEGLYAAARTGRLRTIKAEGGVLLSTRPG